MFILRVTGEGEIFFPQNRVGQGDKDFRRPTLVPLSILPFV